MKRLDFTLLADGSSDAILIHPLTWLLRQCLNIPIDGTWADLRRLPHPPKDLWRRIQTAIDLYPCDILFVHRDAEGEPYERRVEEIAAAIAGLPIRSVPVIPIRMQEAWLLIDEPALRRAAGNPHGQIELEMPSIDRLEDIPSPKQLLHDLLLSASERTGRRRKNLRPGQLAWRLGDLIEDYSPLRRLFAFQQVETAIRSTLDDLFALDHHSGR
jgi:hypothetical protein